MSIGLSSTELEKALGETQPQIACPAAAAAASSIMIIHAQPKIFRGFPDSVLLSMMERMLPEPLAAAVTENRAPLTSIISVRLQRIVRRKR
jgi:hypothetical protein